MSIDRLHNARQQPQVIYQQDPGFTSQGQCDCACQVSGYPPYPSLSVAQKSIGLSALQKTDFSVIPLDSEHVACYHPPYPLVVVNRSALKIFNDLPCTPYIPSMPASYNQCSLDQRQATIVKFVEAGLLVQKPANDLAQTTATNMLSTWMHITDRCNLRCAYCYLPHEPRDMSLSTGYAAIDSLFRSAVKHSYTALKIKYAGGEPLLQFPRILEIHRYAQLLGDQHHLEIDGIILSNGTLLTGEIIDQLKENKLRLMISLDGLGPFHDCHRFQSNWKGSFEIVAQAIEMACANHLSPHISITVSNRNIDGLADTVGWLLERKLQFNINFYRPNPYSDHQADLELESQRIIDGMRAAFKVIERQPPQYNLLNSLMDTSNLATPHQQPCAMGKDYMVFGPDGQIARCQMDIQHSITDCTNNDPLAVLHRAGQEPMNPAVESKEDCQNCEWRYACAGGCPLQAYRTTGVYQRKSPNCLIYKTLFPEILRLEGLRLLARKHG